MVQFLHQYKRQLAVLAFFVLGTSLLPIVDVYHAVGSGWQGVPPVYMDEDYYYARMNEIKDGHPSIGNPYFYEHRNDIAPTFFVTDWLATLPLLLGASLPVTLAFNFSLWSLLFALLVFLVFLELRVHRNLAMLGAFFLYIQSYLLILRPVAMQQVFPFFFLFIFVALRWYRTPEKRTTKIFLAVTAAVPFYLYAYLWQIVGAAFVILTILLLALQDRLRLRNLVFPSALALLLALPALFYTLIQLKNPFYWQMAERISLVYTHLPTAEVVYSGGWVILALCIFFIVWKQVVNADNSALLIMSVLGLALVSAQASNLITGKEVETAVHVKRFIIPWLGISLFTSAAWLYHGASDLAKRPKVRWACYALVFLLGAANVYFVNNFSDYFFSPPRDVRVQKLQTLAAPLHYLDTTEASPIVVWVTNPESDFAYYLPALTKHYVLYAHPGMWQLVSNDEVIERYLAANYFHSVTKESLIAGLGAYAGPAAFAHRANTVNRGVRLCQIFRLETLGYSCGSPVTPEQVLGEEYFTSIIHYNENEVRPHIKELLTKYHVSYIASPKPLTESMKDFFGAKLVYDDQRYMIYRVIHDKL